MILKKLSGMREKNSTVITHIYVHNIIKNIYNLILHATVVIYGM